MSKKDYSAVFNEEIKTYLLKDDFSVIRGTFFKTFKEKDCQALLSLKVDRALVYNIQFTPNELQGTVLEESVLIKDKLLQYQNFERLTNTLFKDIEKLRKFLKNQL